nr:MAG TPA: hypothetical protein [Caudoviricetes sp.]
MLVIVELSTFFIFRYSICNNYFFTNSLYNSVFNSLDIFL